MNPWLGILLVLAALGMVFLFLHLLGRFVVLHPEVRRKLLHVLMGLVTAGFPWLFHQVWPVLVLAAASFSVLVLVRSDMSLVRPFRGILHGVERPSWGELLFPLSVALVFVLAQGDPLFYSVPILILTLADAVAALIGVYYGQTQFKTLEGSKSVEGSVAFFIVTFFCVHVAMLLFTDIGRPESLLIGVLMGIIVMMFEAVAWRGLDNLFIPVASYALLKSYQDLDAGALAVRLLAIVLLGLFFMFWRRRSTLDGSALVGAGLVAYGAWAIGGPYWLLVPVSVFVIGTVLAQRMPPEKRQKIHTVYALLSIIAPGFIWLILSRNSDSAGLLFAYAVAFAAHLTMMGVSRAHSGRSYLPVQGIVPAVFQGLVVVMLPFLLMWGPDLRLLAVLLLGGIALTLTGLVFLRLQPALDNCPGTPERWTRQALIAGGFSTLAWLSVSMADIGVLTG